MILFVVGLAIIFVVISFSLGYKLGKQKPVSFKVVHQKGYRGYQAYEDDGMSTMIFKDGERAKFKELTVHDEEYQIIVEAEGVEIIDFPNE